jgi:hypothetical protein
MCRVGSRSVAAVEGDLLLDALHDMRGFALLKVCFAARKQDAVTDGTFIFLVMGRCWW